MKTVLVDNTEEKCNLCWDVLNDGDSNVILESSKPIFGFEDGNIILESSKLNFHFNDSNVILKVSQFFESRTSGRRFTSLALRAKNSEHSHKLFDSLFFALEPQDFYPICILRPQGAKSPITGHSIHEPFQSQAIPCQFQIKSCMGMDWLE
jgi:hypothetical protein